jgi:hypothetical protein
VLGNIEGRHGLYHCVEQSGAEGNRNQVLVFVLVFCFAAMTRPPELPTRGDPLANWSAKERERFNPVLLV